MPAKRSVWRLMLPRWTCSCGIVHQLDFSGRLRVRTKSVCKPRKSRRERLLDREADASGAVDEVMEHEQAEEKGMQLGQGGEL